MHLDTLKKSALAAAIFSVSVIAIGQEAIAPQWTSSPAVPLITEASNERQYLSAAILGVVVDDLGGMISVFSEKSQDIAQVESTAPVVGLSVPEFASQHLAQSYEAQSYADMLAETHAQFERSQQVADTAGTTSRNVSQPPYLVQVVAR